MSNDFPVPVSLKASLAQFQADLEAGKALYRKFKAEVEAEGVSLRGTAAQGDGTKPPLVMQPPNLVNNGGPHNWSPTAARGGANISSIPSNGDVSWNLRDAMANIAPPRGSAMGIAQHFYDVQRKHEMGEEGEAPGGGRTRRGDSHGDLVRFARQAKADAESGVMEYGSRYGSASPLNRYTGDRLGRTEVEFNPHPYGSSSRINRYTGRRLGETEVEIAPTPSGSHSRLNRYTGERLGESEVEVDPSVGRKGNFRTQDLGGLRSNLHTGEITGDEHALDSPLLKRVKKYAKQVGEVGAILYATRVMSASIEATDHMQDAYQDAGDDVNRMKLGKVRGKREFAGAVLSQPVATLLYGADERRARSNVALGDYRRRRDVEAYHMYAASAGVDVGKYSTSPFASALQSNYAGWRSGMADFSPAAMNEALATQTAGLKGDAKAKVERSIVARFQEGQNRTDYAKNVADVGTQRQLDQELAMTGFSNLAKNMQSQLRPVAGMAAATSGAAIFQLRSERQQATELEKNVQSANNPGGIPVAAISKLRDLAKAHGQAGLADLELQKTDVLKNIYGGRPEEVNSMQSVEAMKDISPESNQAALNALTRAIEALTIELNKKN